ncbi:hypothetical protein K6X12_06005 [Xanthomonas euvesicatoria pv. allii]|uniref:hypothetical protein n=1 Tax=Xanthomonas euvesicatoria TaxID=456327 RepID=UPI0024051C01|nr:hypothetical protein [Xanthomonas euvesicatoria]MCP3038742.1 hypothetical protein [Xanthomonas euvesicatoria pv. allii]MCP3050654.1 hypothetical protein [Xanthomonas euvesicatoria pv. allii]
MEKRRRNEFWYKKNFALAVPALAFSCGYIYEWGRFAYLKIPAEMIDLPVTRMIASGIVLSGCFLLAAAGFSRLRNFFLSKRNIVRYIGASALLYMIFAMPFMVLTFKEKGPMVWLLWLVPAMLAFTAWSQIEDEGSTSNSGSISDFGFLSVTAIFVAANIFSLGYIVESAQIRRSCLEDKKRTLIVEVQSARLLIKEVEKNGVMRSWVLINRSDEDVKIVQCLVTLPAVIKIFKSGEKEKIDMQPPR